MQTFEFLSDKLLNRIDEMFDKIDKVCSNKL